MEKLKIYLSDNFHSTQRDLLFKNFLYELTFFNNIENMKKKCKYQLEILYNIGGLNIIKIIEKNCSNFQKDEIAIPILQKFDHSYKDNEPAKIVGDGNRFYRSIAEDYTGLKLIFMKLNIERLQNFYSILRNTQILSI